MLSLDDRQLLVELQSLGVRVIDETSGPLPGRLGGAGPSDALFLWVRGLPLTVPSHAGYVSASPYTVRVEGKRASLYREDELVGPVTLPPKPRIYDMETADGVPYWKIALLHLDSIASTVVQKCIYWDTPEQCGFCGIELTRGEQTIPVKTPAQLAEVCTAARDYDHAVDVTLDHGFVEPPRPRRDLHLALRGRDQRGVRDADPGPVRAARRSARAGRGARGRRRRGRHPPETFDPEVLARVAPGKAQCGIEGYFRTWERAVDVFGRGSVTTYVLLGMGEREELIVEGCRRAIAMGVYPFVVPLRPVPGTLMADNAPPDPDYVARIYAEVAAMLSEAGFDHLDAKAGCARCQACSGLSAWERVMRREDGAGLDDLFVGSHR